MERHDLICWKCGAALAELPLPFGRLAECPACRAYLHACVMCRYYDKNVTKACREDDAEEVIEKERANFCEYYQPRPQAYRAAAHGKAQQARTSLDALFSGEAKPDATPADEARRKLDDLFGGK